MRALCFVVALGACGTTSGFMPTNPPPHPLTAKSPDQVEIFTASKPARDFVEIGILQSATASAAFGGGDFEMLRRLRTEAATHGCDGVIVTDSSKVAMANGDTASERTGSFRAACIVYRLTTDQTQ